MKLALYSHPGALELSVKARIFLGWLESLIMRWMVITAAMNLTKFIENYPISDDGSSYCHANLSELYLSIPCSYASEMVVSVGSAKVILLISIPSVLTFCSRDTQSWMSFLSCFDGICDQYFLQRCSKLRR